MYLNWIEIENLRAIRNLRLVFGSGAEPRRWTVLLGENGCGKSTVLKAIGLVLAGSDALYELLGNPSDWVRNGARVASIRAQISTAKGQSRSIELAIHRGDSRDAVVKRNANGLKPLDEAIAKAERNYFIAGYGAFRRPPDLNAHGLSSSQQSGLGRGASVATLYSPSRELVSLEQWAMDLDYREGIKGQKIIRGALGKLLPGMSFKRIDKRDRRLIMETVDGDVDLRNLSEGYQVMAAWAGDILFRMTEIFGDRKEPLHARGLLLIDEMDLHLHPVWKRNFVDFLNEAFPHLQIVATTHSPLSIQQCAEGELYVVRRNEKSGPELVAFKGDPSKLRLSELFLSPLIGLDTLDSPKVAALRAQARSIELKPGEKTSADLSKLRDIAAKLEGTTPLPAVEAPALAMFLTPQKKMKVQISGQSILRMLSDATTPMARTKEPTGSLVVAGAKSKKTVVKTITIAKSPAKKSAAKKRT